MQLATARVDLQELEARIPLVEESHDKVISILKGSIKNAEIELAYNRSYMTNRQVILEKMTELAEQGIIPELELQNYRLSEDWSSKNVQVAQKTLEQTALEMERLETERRRSRAEEQAGLQKLRGLILSLQEQLADCEDDVWNVRSPVDGVILDVPNRNVGSVIRQDETLCQLSEKDGVVLARLNLDEDALPRLETRSLVRYFFDAFPYQRYGTATGQLDWVSPAAVTTPSGTRFVAHADLAVDSLNVNGEPRPLHPGMTGEARINVGSRTPVEFAFEPIRQLRENLCR